GYGGLFTAANLLTNDKMQNKLNITIIDKNLYHQLLQQIHLIAADLKQYDDIAFSIKDLMKNDVKFVNKKISRVDLDKKTVTTLEEEKTNKDANILEYKFDYLVIAIGSTNSFFNIEGAEKYAYSFRSIKDAIIVKDRLQKLDKDSNVIICGGGATGISLAGALTDKYKSFLKIIIVEAQNRILPGWDPKLVDEVVKFLKDRGVKIITKNPIKKVSPDFILLADDTKIHSSLSIWTAGIKGQSLEINPDVKKTKSDRIFVNKYSQIEGFKNSFVVGDISAFSIGNDQISPQLAQFAVRQARNVAKNILRIEKGEKPLIEFNYHQSGSILSLGKTCIGLINRVIVKGILCEYVEDFLIDNYITSIKKRGRGLSGLVYDQDTISQISASLNFMLNAASRIFSTHNNGSNKE
ncbi:MAG: FAD-dependent oxidoreductase, partial [Nitrososphaeraceae archaeon]|nr:FAD-dependent oxidoreductase [Nitrososphaeraceae archaeon]